ncbi:MAG: hypothetical protein WBX15_03955 [Thermoanaerobaculia bacterium]
MIIIGIVFILIGLFGIANSIFMFIPAFVQGHAVNSTALRVIEGLLSAAFVVGGIIMIAAK